MIEKLLALAGDDPPETRRSRLVSFHLAVLLTVVTELIVRKVYSREAWLSGYLAPVTDHGARAGAVFTLGMALCLLGLVFERSRRAAAVTAAALMVASVAWYFPGSANHAYLMALCLCLLAVLDVNRPDEQQLALQTLRWSWAIVFFATGVQKAVYGLYDRGEFLTYMIATEETFAVWFRLLMPAEEFARVQAIASTGPFLSEWLPLVLMSNLVLLFEIVAPVLLIYRPTRGVAIVLTLGFVVAIELGAREIFFGVMSVNLTLLFARRDWIRPLLPGYLVLFALLILTQAGVIFPGFAFF